MQGGRGRARNLHDHQIGLASSRNESDCGSLAVTGGNILPGHIMATDDGLLFTPVSIGKLTLPGRLIKTATAETRASDDGFVTPELKIGRAHVCTPVTNAKPVCRLLLETKN